MESVIETHLRLEHLDLAVQATFGSRDLGRQFARQFAPNGYQFCPVLAQFGSKEVLYNLHPTTSFIFVSLIFPYFRQKVFL